MKKMTERQQLYNELPETFSPKQMMNTVNEMDVKDFMKSRSWIQSVLDSWMFSKRIERVQRGIYRKLNERHV